LRIFDDTIGYWVWSPHGPSDNGINFGRSFVDGMIPYPVPGDIAQEMESFAYMVEKYEPGTWFAGWEKDPDSYRFRPIFQNLEVSGPGLPSLNAVTELPETLPDEYRELYERYTKGGKLRKLVDGN